MRGTVIKWYPEKHYGFLKVGGQPNEIFAHERRVAKGPLYKDATVLFDLYDDSRHPVKCATNIRLVREK